MLLLLWCKDSFFGDEGPPSLPFSLSLLGDVKASMECFESCFRSFDDSINVGAFGFL